MKFSELGLTPVALRAPCVSPNSASEANRTNHVLIKPDNLTC